MHIEIQLAFTCWRTALYASCSSPKSCKLQIF